MLNACLVDVKLTTFNGPENRSSKIDSQEKMTCP
jgi:hypothetical protein